MSTTATDLRLIIESIYDAHSITNAERDDIIASLKKEGLTPVLAKKIDGVFEQEIHDAQEELASGHALMNRLLAEEERANTASIPVLQESSNAFFEVCKNFLHLAKQNFDAIGRSAGAILENAHQKRDNEEADAIRSFLKNK